MRLGAVIPLTGEVAALRGGEVKADMPGLVDPTGEVRRPRRSMAPRGLETLRGARVGLVDSGKRNADRFVQALGELLRERFGVAEILLRRKPNATLPAPGELLDELSETCAAVVHGVGD